MNSRAQSNRAWEFNSEAGLRPLTLTPPDRHGWSSQRPRNPDSLVSVSRQGFRPTGGVTRNAWSQAHILNQAPRTRSARRRDSSQALSGWLGGGWEVAGSDRKMPVGGGWKRQILPQGRCRYVLRGLGSSRWW